MPLNVLQNLFCKLMNCLSTKPYSILLQQQTTDLFKVKNYLTLKSRSEKALTLVRDRNNNRPTKATHFMKCSRRSVTNLAALTIGLPGSLNVRVLCSMYRTSHINEERRLHPNSWQKRKKKEGQFLAVYMNRGKKVTSFFSFTVVFHDIRECAHRICCPKWAAAGSFLWLPVHMLYSVVIYTNGFKNIQLTLLRKTQLWHFSFYYSFMIYIIHPISPLNSD